MWEIHYSEYKPSPGRVFPIDVQCLLYYHPIIIRLSILTYIGILSHVILVACLRGITKPIICLDPKRKYFAAWSREETENRCWMYHRSAGSSRASSWRSFEQIICSATNRTNTQTHEHTNANTRMWEQMLVASQTDECTSSSELQNYNNKIWTIWQQRIHPLLKLKSFVGHNFSDQVGTTKKLQFPERRFSRP